MRSLVNGPPVRVSMDPPPFERRNMAPLANAPPPPLERRNMARAIDTGGGGGMESTAWKSTCHGMPLRAMQLMHLTLPNIDPNLNQCATARGTTHHKLCLVRVLTARCAVSPAHTIYAHTKSC